MQFDPRTADTPESEVGSGGTAPENGSDGQPDAPTGPAETPAEPAASESAPGADDQSAPDVEALSAKAAKAEEYLNMAQRTRAEFENYRRRAVREAAAAQERGIDKLALELLPAIDNLDRALAHAATVDEGNGDASFVHGVKHVHADVLAALKRSGIEPFSPEGEPFDPQFHEAVAQQPLEGATPGTVVEVYQRGYRRGESILRPARVVVAG